MSDYEDHDDVPTAARACDVDEAATVLSMDDRLTRAIDADGHTPLALAEHGGHGACADAIRRAGGRS